MGGLPLYILKTVKIMAIVRVSAGVFLLTESVGKIIQTQCVEASVRKTQTDVYDATGQHV